MVTFEVTTSNSSEPPMPFVMPRANPLSPDSADATDLPAAESSSNPDSLRALLSSLPVNGRKARRRAENQIQVN